ncbi:hypothetical protein NFI96_006242 [Prochilodus magdalenae]|nr:hypothetical protein NFI96_006242 [Prochilodus magdalenae]
MFKLHGMDYHRTPLGTSTAPYRDVWRVGLANTAARRHTERQTSEKRLRDRKTESEESLQKRLHAASVDLEISKEPGLFDVVIINDGLDDAYGKLKDALLKSLIRGHRTLPPRTWPTGRIVLDSQSSSDTEMSSSTTHTNTTPPPPRQCPCSAENDPPPTSYLLCGGPVGVLTIEEQGNTVHRETDGLQSGPVHLQSVLYGVGSGEASVSQAVPPLQFRELWALYPGVLEYSCVRWCWVHVLTEPCTAELTEQVHSVVAFI